MEVPRPSLIFYTTNNDLDGKSFDVTSCSVIKLKDWYVKVSTTSFNSICVILTHSETLYTTIAFFTDEIIAHTFITKTVNEVF